MELLLLGATINHIQHTTKELLQLVNQSTHSMATTIKPLLCQLVTIKMIMTLPIVMFSMRKHHIHMAQSLDVTQDQPPLLWEAIDLQILTMIFVLTIDMIRMECHQH